MGPNTWRPLSHCAILPLVITIFALPLAELYNLEPRLPLFKYGPGSSNFGFSVALHRLTVEETGAKDSLMVVGAPTADTIRSQRGLKAPERPGGVFYCRTTTNPDDCKRVQMDANGNRVDYDGVTHRKDNQWLGVSLKSQGPGKFLVSCAHRYSQYLFLNQFEREIERVCGKCFLLNADNSGSIVEVDPRNRSLSMNFISLPCSKFPPKYQKQVSMYAFAQAGSSVSVTSSGYVLASPCDYMKNDAGDSLRSKSKYGYMQAGSSLALENKEYVLGAPGSFRWTGAIFDIGMPKTSYYSEIDAILGSSGPAHFYRTPVCFPGRALWDEKGIKCRRLPLRRDSYMGFSVATSNAIDPNTNAMSYAAGAPRGNDTGAVVFFKRYQRGEDDVALQIDYTNIVLGETIGSSFGYSIALTDINGDGLDDLIVGAPQYYEYTIKRKAGGAIYVYKNKAGSGFRDVVPQVFYGPLESYFGHVVAALGDIDQDGYGDFAVGSPYENVNGVVHIFRGSKDGVVKESQVIQGKSYPYVSSGSGRELFGFGASLSGTVDTDSNKYPDLLIGSFSDHIALLRSRPIISINMTLEVDREEFDLEEKDCKFGGKNIACFQIAFCFQYTARHSEYTGNLTIRYKLLLDTLRKKEGKLARTHLDGKDGPSESAMTLTLLAAGVKVCPGRNGTRDIYFGNGVKDRLSSIGVQLELELDLPEVRREKVGDDIFDMMKDPILDADFDKIKKKVIRIKNTCGTDGCQSDLKIKATMPDEVVVGNNISLPLMVYLSNDKEEAHQAYFTVSLPSNVDYETFSVTKASNNSKILCFPSNTGTLIRCDIGNPYKSGAEDQIEITLGVSRVTSKDKRIQVIVEGFTSSENPKIPPIYLQANVWIELDLSLTTFAQPQQVRYTEKDIIGERGMNTTSDIGPQIQYTFNVKNEGSDAAAEVKLDINLPVEIFNGKWLLYLVASDVTAGGDVAVGRCESEYINTLRLEPSLPVPGRTKRAAEIEPEISSRKGRTVYATLACSKKSKCAEIQCDLDVIPGGTTTSVVLQVRLWEATFLEEKLLNQLDLVYINTTGHLATDEKNVRFKTERISATVQTTVDHEFLKSDISSTFPWWYILIAVILLLLLYILIIFLLIKCGFFKRKRYPPQERDENDHVVLEE